MWKKLLSFLKGIEKKIDEAIEFEKTIGYREENGNKNVIIKENK